jgi:putative iron-only hydrogenase system regulator
MEKRIGTVSILVTNRNVVHDVNALLSAYADHIVLRTGLPMREENVYVITLIVRSAPDIINAFTGKVGRLKDVKVKSNLVTM